MIQARAAALSGPSHRRWNPVTNFFVQRELDGINPEHLTLSLMTIGAVAGTVGGPPLMAAVFPGRLLADVVGGVGGFIAGVCGGVAATLQLIKPGRSMQAIVDEGHIRTPYEARCVMDGLRDKLDEVQSLKRQHDRAADAAGHASGTVMPEDMYGHLLSKGLWYDDLTHEEYERAAWKVNALINLVERDGGKAARGAKLRERVPAIAGPVGSLPTEIKPLWASRPAAPRYH